MKNIRACPLSHFDGAVPTILVLLHRVRVAAARLPPTAPALQLTCTAKWPVPPAAAVTTTTSPGCTFAVPF